jgi:hypothetical protein
LEGEFVLARDGPEYRMDKYNPARDVTSTFVERVAGWIHQGNRI